TVDGHDDPLRILRRAEGEVIFRRGTGSQRLADFDHPARLGDPRLPGRSGWRSRQVAEHDDVRTRPTVREHALDTCEGEGTVAVSLEAIVDVRVRDVPGTVLRRPAEHQRVGARWQAEVGAGCACGLPRSVDLDQAARRGLWLHVD